MPGEKPSGGDVWNGYLGIACTRNDQSSKIENAAKDALIHLDAFDFVEVQFNCLSADKASFGNNPFIGKGKFGCLVANVGDYQLHNLPRPPGLPITIGTNELASTAPPTSSPCNC